jgi:hypothetical protein
MALIASYFMQYGGQLFALVVSASTVAKAPPRSFAMFEGEYGYDSSAFWDTVPTITAILFVVSLVANWRTGRRNLLVLAAAMFVVGAILAIFLLMPEFAELQAIPFRDVVDPALQRRAAKWLALDWAVWSLGAISGLALLVALARPIPTDRP